MHHPLLAPARFCFPTLLLALCWCVFPAFAQKPITLEDIWKNGTFTSKSVPGFRFQRDGIHYTQLQGSTLEQYDLRTGQRSAILLDASKLSTREADWTDKLSGYTFSDDESKLLLTVGKENIYRWSTRAYYFVYDLRTQSLQALHQGSKQRYATFSPDGSKVAFVLENDLYVKDLATQNTTRVTQDGRVNEIINGASDWVYEEEFELVRAFEWSPDGQRLAYLRFDERAVPEFTMEMYRDSTYPELVTFKYPKVGEPNATVTAHIYDLKSSRTVKVNDPMTNDDSYLPRIHWAPTQQLCLTWMNRHQNHQRLLLADPATGTCTLLLEEKNKYYLDLHDITFLSDGSGFVMQSEKSGYNHLYRYDMTGRQVAALTQGKYDVTAFYGLDEKNGLAYFQAAAQKPMQRELYAVKLNGKGQKKISKEPGVHSAQHSSTFDYFVDTYSTLNSPPRYTVRDRKGKVVRQLEQNQALADKQKEYGTIPATFIEVPLPYPLEAAREATPSSSKGGRQGMLNGFLIKPTAPQYQGKKLPVLMFVYGGPGNQQVMDQWKGANYWWFQMLAQQGYVVACVDNRGTGGRGEEFKKMTYQQLGNLETQDQIAAARHLGTLPYIDRDHIGIFGWSYGGYMSSLCLLKGADVFKSAIAVAPVTNWKWYDSVYTERYMRTHQENPQGYEQNSPINFADQLRGNYLLVHGLADDNVHFQHTAEMSNRLIAADKQYDTMIYPNRNHGIGAQLHLYTLMTNFLQEKLKGQPREATNP